MLDSIYYSRNEIDDQKWNAFIDRSPEQVMYAYCWYLDIISTNWSAVVVTKNNQWIAVMPITVSKKMNFKYALQPLFAQYLGVFFNPLSEIQHKKIFAIKSIIYKITDALPSDIWVVNYNLSPSISYALPFFWKKYETSPRYSYWLDLRNDFGKIYNNFSTSIKNHIKKARNGKLEIVESKDVNVLLQICEERKILNSNQCQLFEKLWRNIVLQKKGFVLYAKDSEGNIHSGGAFLKDKKRVVFILLAQKMCYKKYGANALLIQEAIRKSMSLPNVEYFDFEGSMIERVENYFRGFNPEPKVYMNIRKSKVPNFLINWYRSFSN